MLFRTKLLAGCVAGLLASSVALADSNVEFKGYARAGFSLNLSKFDRQADSQGEQFLSTRHVRNLNYFQLWVTKNLENSKFVLSIDNETFQRIYEEDFWGASEFRVRDAYYQTELSSDLAVWAGIRQFIFDDIRVLDILNEYKAQGLGLILAKDTNIFISKSKATKVQAVKLADQNPGYEKEQDLEVVAHSKIDLGGMTLSPEVAVIRSGVVTQAGEKKLSSKTAFTGRVLLGVSGTDMWNNLGIRYTQSPNYVCNDVACSDNKLSTIELTESGSFDFGSLGVLVGAIVKYEKYKDEVQMTKKNGTQTTAKSRVVASVDVQPVYYATNNFHLALDINKIFKTKYTGDRSAALLITPIARYALAKNTIGQAQVYTSVTYGKYDQDDSIFNGKKNTDSLVTMQTGFELAF